MGKRKIKYFYFDLDGTLLTDKKLLLPENVQALQKLMALGYEVGIISGRPDYIIKKEIATIKPSLPLVTMNGGKITSQKKCLALSFISPDVLSRITSFLVAHDITFLGYSETILYHHGFANKSEWIARLEHTNAHLQARFRWSQKPFVASDNTKLAKILVIASEMSAPIIRKLRVFITSLSNVYIVTSSPGVLDIMPHGVSKGKALQFLSQKGLIALNQTVVFGDADNDLSMFAVAGFSVAMQNASRDVKQAATMVSKLSNNDGGVARFVRKEFLHGQNHDQ